MKTVITYLRIMVFLPFIVICSNQSLSAQGGNGGGGNGGGGNGGGGNGGGGHEPPTETAGNNLSFPVIFADGGSKVLPGTIGEYSLEGEWWYVWGEDPIDPQAPLYSCEPLENNSGKCKDGTDPGDGNSMVYKAFIQKDPKNVWQAHNTHVTPGETLNVDWVDWGDNLESIAWKINSKVRTEVVLYEDIDSVAQFSMRHVDSWGIDEVHGAQTTLEEDPIYAEGTQATVFTPKARLTMQKLNFTSSSIDPSRLIWVAETGWTEVQGENVDIINEPMFNQAISEAGSGPAFFNAEINVKGKIMFGYTWDVGSLNEGEGYYRLTFSFDEGDEAIGTAKFDEFTQIIVAEEEEEDHTETAKITEIAEGGPGGGGVPVMDPSNNLTYIDVLIGEDTSEYLPWVAVTALELIDAVNDVSLGLLTDGMTININEIPVSSLSVEAIATNDVGSVKLELSGEHATSITENVPPYTLFGHTNGDYSGNNFPLGNYNLTVTPYSEDDLTGDIGIPLTVSFEMVSAPPEGAGNNLSFPVIWADGGSKALRGTMGEYSLEGEWWYVWGEDPIDPQAQLYSCKPSEHNQNKCEDNSDPGDGGLSTVYKAYIQKDVDNTWQAYNTSVPAGETMSINWVDWGDNLESVPWKINSKVRTEMVLLKDIDSVTQFNMRHVNSWGIDEVHGLQTTLEDEVVYGQGIQATVFTPKARLTIQKLNFTSESIPPSRLSWLAEEKRWAEANPEEEFDIINEPIFNQAASEAGDGSGYFNAEVNVKGKIIFGYTWDVNNLNQGEGHYRLTFSFDEGDEAIGTTKFDEFTKIVVPIEEESTLESKVAEDGPGGGGAPVMNAANNLTYIDVLIGESGQVLSTKHSSQLETETFVMYPNPTTGIINIKNTTGNLVNIYDILGHKVFTARIDSASNVKTINLSTLQSGLYFVKISDGRNASVKKIIIK